MAEAIVSTVVAPVIENSVNTVGRQFGYLWNYRKNMDNLEKQVKVLDSKIIDMGRSVIAAERNAEEIGNEVQGWLSEAKEISGRARDLLEKHTEKGKNRCLVRLCPNLVSRHQFSRSACKKETDVVEAITKERHIRKVSFHPVGQESTIMSIERCFTFDSRKSIIEDIMKVLQDETKRLVGVYGLGGMGKTTLAKQIASQAKEEKLFEEVVFASVTEKVYMKEIQGQIANVLDLKLDESTIAERAKRVHQRLKGKTVLVILDDLWVKLDLNEVGVSFGTEHMGCKILLTSRFRHVLTSMGTEKDFDLGALNEEESWRLFEEKTCNVLKSPDFHNIGKEIAKRCRGWPILIVTVAASLSRRPQMPAWKDALNQIKKMNNKEMHDIVNSAIESISYNHLDKTHKRLFLLCGITGGVGSIEELLQYSWGWGLFDGEATTIQEARDRLHNLILDLKDSCLLLNVDSRNFIKMHDVVRDVAISIGKKDLHMFSLIEDDGELNICPNDDDLKKCTAMILRGFPPSNLEWSSLDLFVMTSKLKVLGMSRLPFTSLPQCLSFLTNLQTLRVDNCECLKDISVVVELKNLQTLSFVGSGIEELPSGIGQMTKLRLLDMRRCYKLKAIPGGLIKALFRLEELYIPRSFDKWEADMCVSSNISTNGSLRELEHLPNLCSLEISVSDDKFFLENLKFEKLERYEIIVGDLKSWRSYGSFWLDRLQVTRTICLKLSTTSINQLQFGVKRLFKRVECLWLGELQGIKNVVPALDEDGFPNLKHLQIQKDYDIEYVVNVEDKGGKVVFPSLESLQLIQLLKLQKLCNGSLMEQSFCSLTILKVDECNELESLFSFSMATRLLRLQQIEVSLCNVLEGIVVEKNVNDDGVCDKIEFAQLHKLVLKCLPKLKNFFSSGVMQKKSQKFLRSDDTDYQEIHAEEEEKELISSLPFFRKVSFPKLQELILYKIFNLTEIWSHNVSDSCCNLTKLEINNCDNLVYLLTPSVAMILVGLQSLTITHCARMKHVVAREEGEINTMTINFPQLSYLCLENLVHLTTFCEEMDSSENLDRATQPLFSEKVLFPKLQELKIHRCDKLKYVMTPSVTLALEGLQSLTLVHCARMKHIVAKEEEDTNTMPIAFPQLSYLCLQDLDNLTTFYSGLCEEMKNSDIATRPLFNEKVSIPKLHYLVLSRVSNLSEIWNHELQGTPCRELTTLTIHQCKSLKHVFPDYLVPSLNKLEYLNVEDCEVLETVIGDDKSVEKTTTFLFPKLTEVKLHTLPKAECLYLRKHTIQCPELKELKVADCGKLHAFDFLSFPEKQGDALFEKILANLKNTSIRNSDMMKILGLYDHHLPPLLFRGLENLEILEFHGGRVVFPSKLLNIIHNQLQEFRVFDCSFKEIFPFEEQDIHDDILLPRLYMLTLQKLPGLKYICKHGQYTQRILNALERLWIIEVVECPCLINFVPSAVSFISLANLTVKDCSVLTNLIQPSTAKSLKRLSFLRISGCEMMEKIIGDDEESSQDGDEFVFPNLRHMELEKLPRLTSFCSSSNHAFNFPDLFWVIVRECPNMKTFSGGITTTPKLNDIRYEGERRWDGDLNTTVQQSFAKMEAKRLPTALPSTSSSNHVEANALSPENSSIDSMTEVESCPKPEKEPEVSKNSTKSRKGKEVEFSKFQEFQTPSTALASSSSNSQFGPKAEIREKVAEPKEEDEICKLGVDKLGKEIASFVEHSHNVVASSSHKGLRVAKDSVLLSEFVQILQTQPVSNVSAEHVQFVEDAIGLFSTYVDSAKQCLERKNAISELKRQMQALEEENEVVASSAPRFG